MGTFISDYNYVDMSTRVFGLQITVNIFTIRMSENHI